MNLNIPLVFMDPLAKAGDETAISLLLPKKATPYAAGYDLVAANTEPILLQAGKRAAVPTGIAIALPENMEAQVRPRSGLALKNGLTVLNAPGTIDSDYRGEIKVILVNLGEQDFTVERGMRIAQLVISQVIPTQLVPATSLEESERGSKGFGSSGV